MVRRCGKGMVGVKGGGGGGGGAAAAKGEGRGEGYQSLTILERSIHVLE